MVTVMFLRKVLLLPPMTGIPFGGKEVRDDDYQPTLPVRQCSFQPPVQKTAIQLPLWKDAVFVRCYVPPWKSKNSIEYMASVRYHGRIGGLCDQIFRMAKGENVDVEEEIEYWRTGSDEDWEAAKFLLTKNKVRHGLFFLHLAMEKLIKAHVCRVTKDNPPRIHNLIRLMQCANLLFDQKQGELLVEMNSFCLEGRYADRMAPTPSRQYADNFVKRAMEVRTWLLSQL